MMLETLIFNMDIKHLIRLFEYRAENPIIVDRPCIIKGAWDADGKPEVKLWAEHSDGTVGMTGQAHFYEYERNTRPGSGRTPPTLRKTR